MPRPMPSWSTAIYARSGGNAFFAEELLAAESAPGRLPRHAGRGPRGASRHAQRTSPGADPRRVRRRSTHPIAAPGSGQPTRRPRALCIAPRGVGVADPDPPKVTIASRSGTPSSRRRSYDDLLPSERIRVHAAFAEMIDEQQVVADEGAMAAELAYHWQAAEDLPRALDASIRAGLAAEAMYALSDAQAHFERALAALGTGPRRGGPGPVRSGRASRSRRRCR